MTGWKQWVAGLSVMLGFGLAMGYKFGHEAPREETRILVEDTTSIARATRAEEALQAMTLHVNELEKTIDDRTKELAVARRSSRTREETRTENRPDGTTVVTGVTEREDTEELTEAREETRRTVERLTQTEQMMSALRRTNEELTDLLATKKVETKVVIVRDTPRLMLGASASYLLGPGKLAYGVDAGVRLAGPVWVDLAYDVPSRALAGSVGVRVAF